VRFYKKSAVERPQSEQRAAAVGQGDRRARDKPSMLNELDGRLSSLSIRREQKDSAAVASEDDDDDDDDDDSSDGSESGHSSKSSSRSPSNASNGASKKKRKKRRGSNKSGGGDPALYSIIPNSVKYEFYLECVIKYETFFFMLIGSRMYEKLLIFVVKTRNDYAEVLHYLITTKKVDPHKRDANGKTLLFVAVMNEKPRILNYLIKRVRIFFYF
jgi:hypothetical protein